MRENLRSKMDDMDWLASLNTPVAWETLICHITDFRTTHGSGWWDTTLEKLEGFARKALENHVPVKDTNSRVKTTYA